MVQGRTDTPKPGTVAAHQVGVLVDGHHRCGTAAGRDRAGQNRQRLDVTARADRHEGDRAARHQNNCIGLTMSATINAPPLMIKKPITAYATGNSFAVSK